jgi:hypothetical protein
MTIQLIGGQERQLDVQLTARPIITIPFGDYQIEIWSIIPTPGAVAVGTSCAIDFMVIDGTGVEKTVSPPLQVHCNITRPDGSVLNDVIEVPEINVSPRITEGYGEECWFWWPGTYTIDFEGYIITYTAAAPPSNIFTPSNMELIYDPAPYCQETIDVCLPEGRDLANLEAIRDKKIDLDLTSVDEQIAPILSGTQPGTYYSSVEGTLVNSYYDPGDGILIQGQLYLIPQDLYAQASIQLYDGLWLCYVPRFIWTYPDPDHQTLETITYALSERASYGSASFTYALGGHLIRCTSPGICSGDLDYLRQYLSPGDRYEAVIQTKITLPSGPICQFKVWHVGYCIIA